MPMGDLGTDIFYTTLTLMMNSYNSFDNKILSLIWQKVIKAQNHIAPLSIGYRSTIIMELSGNERT